MRQHLNKKNLLRLTAGIFLFSTLAVIFYLTPLRKYTRLENVVNLVQVAQSHPWAGLLFYIVFVIGVLGLPITPFPIIGGILYSFWTAFILNTVAATAGAWLAFALIRFFGRAAVETLLRGKLKDFDQITSQQGLKTVLFLRWVGVPPFIVSNYALGLSNIRHRDYVIGTFFGVAPWMALVTFFAHSFWEAILVGGEHGLRRAIFTKLGPLMVISFVIFIIVGTGFLLKLKKRRKASLHKEKAT